MKLLKTLLLVSSALLAPKAHAESPVSGLLTVGGTGISCYMAPCPWRGIAQVDSRQGPVSSMPIWSENVLPALIAHTSERERVTEAWSSDECLVVDGAYDGTTLTIREIIGPCA